MFFEAPKAHYVHLLSLSRDEQFLAFRLADFGNGIKSLQVVPAAGGDSNTLLQVQMPETLTFQEDSYEWTPDGKEILFVRAGGDPLDTGKQMGELVGIPVKGGGPRKYGLALDRLGHIRLHPDGHLLAFQSGTCQGEVWVMEGFLPES